MKQKDRERYEREREDARYYVRAVQGRTQRAPPPGRTPPPRVPLGIRYGRQGPWKAPAHFNGRE